MSHREHCELLQDFVRDRFGVLHCKIVGSLWTYGPLTLHDLATYLRQQTFDVVPPRTSSDVASQSTAAASSSRPSGSLDDGAVKLSVALLHEHSIVSFTESDKSYRLRLGFGLMHCVQPVLLRFMHQRYGDAGSTVISIVAEYGALPRSTISHLMTQRRPALHQVINSTIDQLRLDGVLAAVFDGGVNGSGGETLALKKHRRDDWGSPSNAQPTSSSQAAPQSLSILALNYPVILHMVRSESMMSFLTPRYDDVCLTIIRAAMALDGGKIGGGAHQDGSCFPARLDLSNSISLARIREQLVAIDARGDALIAALTTLSSGASAMLFRGGGSSADEVVRVRYDSIIDQYRFEVCEQVLFARYGILGVRVMKLLLKNHSMEDRFIAEEAIATLHQVREVLTGLMRDGAVRQQEVPKVLSADRQPKQSIFLWVMNKSLLFTTVSSNIAKSLRTARFRLFVEEERLRNKFPTEGNQPPSYESNSMEAANTLDSNLAQQRRVAEHSVRALKASIFALMQQLLVMELFGNPTSA